MKRILSLILAFVFVIGICASAPITITASAIEETNEDGFTFELTEDGKAYALVSVENVKIQGDTLTIPKSFKNLPVTEIWGLAFSFCKIDTIVIPETIERISTSAFRSPELSSGWKGSTIIVEEDNPNYSSVDGVLFNKDKTKLCKYPVNKIDEKYTVPTTVKEIASSAFYFTSNVKTVVLNEGLEEISSSAFFYSSVENINIPSTICYVGNSAFYMCGIYQNGYNWDKGLLYIDNWLVEITEDGLKGDIVIKDGVVAIAEAAFNFHGREVMSISFPDSLEYIGAWAFGECVSLTSVTIPKNVNLMEKSPFYNCKNLKNIFVSNENKNFESVDGVLFNEDKTELVEYPIGKEATTYTVPDTVKKIKYAAFTQSEKLTNVILGANVEYIEAFAFEDCSVLKTVTMPNKVKVIERCAFIRDYELEEINLSTALTGMGDRVFENCKKLSNITIGENLEEFVQDTFDGCDNLTSINVSENNENFSSIDGVLFNGDKTELIIYPKGKCSTLYTVPDGVKKIGKSAFSNCKNIDRISLGNTVEEIGEYAFAYCYTITSIEIPESVKVIGNNAFEYCESLRTVTFNEGLETIGNYAFAGCSKVVALVLPESLESIGEYAFDGCENLTTITIPSQISEFDTSMLFGCYKLASINVSEGNEKYASEDGVLFNGDKTELIMYPKGKCSTLYTVPDGVKKIGESAFRYCDNIDRISLGNTVEEIGEYAFSYCCTLTFVEIPESVKTIGDNAFMRCENLRTVIFNEGLKTIGEDAFYYCYSLSEATLPSTLEVIGERAFGHCSQLTNITIGPNVKTIEWAAFDECKNITSFNVSENNKNYSSVDGVLFNGDKTELILYPKAKCATLYTVPDSVKKIGDYAFRDCYNIDCISLGNTVEEIGEAAFSDCDTITYIEIPKSVKTIGGSAFGSCRSLRTVIFNQGLETIGDNAFSGCFALESLELPESLKSIGNRAFDHCISLANIDIGGNLNFIGEDAFNWCGKLESVDVSKNNKYFVSIDGALFNKDKTELIVYPNANSTTKFSIPEGIQKIVTRTFADNSALKEVEIPDSVLDIEWYAFNGCTSLTSVKIGNNVERIGEEAFYDCYQLKTVTIPENVTQIGYRAFGYYLDEEELEDNCKIPGFTIYGVVGSEAEKYAKENGFIFEPYHTCSGGTATCNKKAVCITCGEEYGELNKNNHTKIETIPAKPSTCTATGLTDGKKCSVCGTTTVAQQIIAKKGHTEVTVTGKAATCTATGLTDGKKCSVCGTTTVAQQIIAKKGHTEVTITGKAATCTATGLTDGKKCSVCGTPTVAQQTIAKKAHTEVTVTGKAATCTATGLTDGKKCSVCNTVTKAQQTIKATGHKEVVIPAVAPTYTTVGKTEGKKCSVCGTVTVAQKDVAKLTLATPVVTVKNSAKGVKVTWKAIDGAESYKVYRKTYSTKTKKYGSWKTCGTVTATSYVDTKAKSGKKYIYTVKALNGDVKSGIKSSSSILFLAQPTVKIANASTGVKVSWNKITGATGYTIYRAEYSGGKWSGWNKMGTLKSTKTSWTDKSVKSGVKYKYTVKAVNGKTASTYKSSSSLLYLAQPKVAVKALSNGIKVAWVQSTGATSYKIYRSEYNAKTKKWSSWKGIKTAKSTSKSYVDKSAKKGVKYRYTVKAVNGKTASAYKSSASVKR